MNRYRHWLGLFILLFSLSACLDDDPFKLPYQGFEPMAEGDGWLLSSPENENMDRALIEQAYQLLYKDTRFTMARSLLVLRNGKLVAEAELMAQIARKN